jgi:hypothetical protein
MYTATITNKEFINGALRVTVEFSDGVTTVTESCIPQDYDGLKFWVKSRLATFNSAKEIDTDLAINDPVDVADPTPVVPVLTQDEIDQNDWIQDYKRWVKVKTTLIDTGVLTGNETQVQALRTRVQNNFKATYINFI